MKHCYIKSTTVEEKRSNSCLVLTTPRMHSSRTVQFKWDRRPSRCGDSSTLSPKKPLLLRTAPNKNAPFSWRFTNENGLKFLLPSKGSCLTGSAHTRSRLMKWKLLKFCFLALTAKNCLPGLINSSLISTNSLAIINLYAYLLICSLFFITVQLKVHLWFSNIYQSLKCIYPLTQQVSSLGISPINLAMNKMAYVKDS